MEKYFVNDYVETKHGNGIITKIWRLNDIITVFDIEILDIINIKYTIKPVYYGEIYKVLYRG